MKGRDWLTWAFGAIAGAALCFLVTGGPHSIGSAVVLAAAVLVALPPQRP